MGALDAISSIPFAAYSLYKLRNAYTGPCLRVIRASDNAQQDIGFSGNFIDAASLDAFCTGTTGYCHTWYDQMGSYNYFNYPDGAARAVVIYVSGSIANDGIRPAITRSTGSWYGTNAGPVGSSVATAAFRGKFEGGSRAIIRFGSDFFKNQSGSYLRWQVSGGGNTQTWLTPHGLSGQSVPLGALFNTNARVYADNQEAPGSTSATAGIVNTDSFSLGPGDGLGGVQSCDTFVLWTGDAFSELETFFENIETLITSTPQTRRRRDLGGYGL